MRWKRFNFPVLVGTSICLLALSLPLRGQELLDIPTLSRKPLYTFEEALKQEPDSVYRLRVRKKISADFETQLLRYSNLQEIQLSGLKLREIPSVVWRLQRLTVLNLANNKLEQLPLQVGQLIYLEQLILNRNYLKTLPSEMRFLQRLRYLDLWSNLIFELPPAMQSLQDNLRTIDMRVIMLNDEEKAAMRALLPHTNFLFSNSCGCTH